ncbi:MAG TPA: hypothetical protein VGM51_02135 [Armatimonadota bacterium]|jgi:hypothetical protein
MDGQYRFVRLVRTGDSEIYIVWEGENRVGQLDLHYAGDIIHGTLILEMEITTTQEEELLTQIDQDVVSSYRPSFDREDFLVTVYRGEEISTYTDAQNDLDGENDGLN